MSCVAQSKDGVERSNIQVTSYKNINKNIKEIPLEHQKKLFESFLVIGAKEEINPNDYEYIEPEVKYEFPKRKNNR